MLCRILHNTTYCITSFISRIEEDIVILAKVSILILLFNKTILYTTKTVIATQKDNQVFVQFLQNW